jgi:hypothetical protein
MKKTWTPDRIALLVELYPDGVTADIAARLGVSAQAINQKAHTLKLRKSAAFMAAQYAALSGNLRATQFAKGGTPWNKGRHFDSGGRSAETRFKPGNRPHTWQPIGSERMAGGFLQRKVSDTGNIYEDWRPVHQLVWLAAGREIPPSHALAFRDGNRMNFALDNLELVSREELMRRNSLHNYGPEIARIYQLRGAIQRQINKRSKGQHHGT